MLITCPDCATRYEMADEMLGRGRTVRCTTCRSTWFAEPAGEAQAAEEEEMVASWREDAQADAEPAAEAEADDFVPAMLEKEDVAPVLHRKAPSIEAVAGRAKRRKVSARRKRGQGGAQDPKRRLLAFVVGGSLALGIVGVLERNAVVSAAPELAGLYASIGLPVNLRGLAFHDVTSRSDFEDGLPVLAVTGLIENVTERPLSVPSLRVALRGEGTAEVYAWTVEPPKREMAPGERVEFRASLTSPPVEARNVFVRFSRGEERAFGSLN